MLTAKEIFTHLLASKEGESIKAKCFTHEEAESIRTSLYRERVKLKEINPDMADRIVISRNQVASVSGEILYVVTVKKSILTAQVTKVLLTGEEELLQKSPAENHPELLRGLKLMKDEGATDVEMDMYKAQWMEEYKEGCGGISGEQPGGD